MSEKFPQKPGSVPIVPMSFAKKDFGLSSDDDLDNNLMFYDKSVEDGNSRNIDFGHPLDDVGMEDLSDNDNMGTQADNKPENQPKARKVAAKEDRPVTDNKNSHGSSRVVQTFSASQRKKKVVGSQVLSNGHKLKNVRFSYVSNRISICSSKFLRRVSFGEPLQQICKQWDTIGTALHVRSNIVLWCRSTRCARI